jgi:hypothetical protein
MINDDEILGYTEELLIVDGGYDYHARSYIFEPIRHRNRGAIATAAFLVCRECHEAIRSMGGGGNRSLCPQCYGVLKLRDFAEGHTHTVIGEENV